MLEGKPTIRAPSVSTSSVSLAADSFPSRGSVRRGCVPCARSYPVNAQRLSGVQTKKLVDAFVALRATNGRPYKGDTHALPRGPGAEAPGWGGGKRVQRAWGEPQRSPTLRVIYCSGTFAHRRCSLALAERAAGMRCWRRCAYPAHSPHQSDPHAMAPLCKGSCQRS